MHPGTCTCFSSPSTHSFCPFRVAGPEPLTLPGITTTVAAPKAGKKLTTSLSIRMKSAIYLRPFYQLNPRCRLFQVERVDHVEPGICAPHGIVDADQQQPLDSITVVNTYFVQVDPRLVIQDRVGH